MCEYFLREESSETQNSKRQLFAILFVSLTLISIVIEITVQYRYLGQVVY